MITASSAANSKLIWKNVGERKDAVMKEESTLAGATRDIVLACSAGQGGGAFATKEPQSYLSGGKRKAPS